MEKGRTRHQSFDFLLSLTCKSMKKRLLILINLTMVLGGKAQSLQGWFLTVEKDQGFNSDLFHFAGNHFFYRNSGCLATTTGAGTFALRHGRLVLYFEQSPADSARVQPSLPCASPTSAPIFCFRIVDKMDGSALPGVSIVSRTTGTGTATDLDGEAVFAHSLPPNDVLAVKSVGYRTIDVPLASATSQGFVVKMGPPYYFSAGDTLIFQLNTLRRYSLALRPVFGSADTDDEQVPYTHCSRIAAGKAKKIIERRARQR
jgi:hypothetical protein